MEYCSSEHLSVSEQVLMQKYGRYECQGDNLLSYWFVGSPSISKMTPLSCSLAPLYLIDPFTVGFLSLLTEYFLPLFLKNNHYFIQYICNVQVEILYKLQLGQRACTSCNSYKIGCTICNLLRISPSIKPNPSSI